VFMLALLAWIFPGTVHAAITTGGVDVSAPLAEPVTPASVGRLVARFYYTVGLGHYPLAG